MRFIRGHNGRSRIPSPWASDDLSRPLPDRFWEKVDRSGGPDACWPWTASKKGDGYGQIMVDGQPIKAHRVAWILTHGPIPPETPVVRHVVCRNRLCCNPAHLAVGTQADNVQDTVRDGMSTRGERHHNANLIEANVLEIRRLYASGGFTQRALAHRFGVSRSVVNQILNAYTWAWLAGTDPARKRGRRRGERCYHAKLSEPQVREIRRLHTVDGLGSRRLASRFGVNRATVNDILAGRTWTHVKEAEVHVA